MSLQGMRNSARSWVMALLFGLLILSFALWGIGDVLRPGVRGNETVAQVGDIKISVDQYRRLLQTTLRSQGQRLGINLTMEQARRLGIDRQVLNQMIDERVTSLGAAGIGIVVSQNLVNRDIQQNPVFRNQSNQFDRGAFIQLLQNNGLSEAGYVALRKGEIARAQLIEAVVANQRVPRSMAERFYRYRNDKRTAEILFIADTGVKGVPNPSQAQIAAYHKANARTFTAPELRTITAIILTLSAVAGEVSVSDDDLRKAYEERKGEFAMPEKRTVEQMLFTTEASAKKAQAALKEGQGFARVAREIAGQKEGALSLGTFARDELRARMAPLADAVFALAVGEAGAPIKVGPGWRILRVTKIEAARTKGFEEVKAQINAAIQKDRAGDLLVKLSNQIEDILGSGASLEDAAGRLNLKTVKFTGIDKTGKDIDAKAVKGVPEAREFLSRAFELDEEEDSGVIETEQGAVFILRVDRIVKPALRAISTIRGKVAAAWKAERRREAALKKANALLERANGGEALAALAKAERLAVRTTEPFTRAGRKAGANVSPALITKIFRAKTSATVMARGSDGYALATIKEITPANPSGDKAGMDEMRKTLVEAMNIDMLTGYTAALKDRLKVDIKRDTIVQMFAQEGGGSFSPNHTR